MNAPVYDLETPAFAHLHAHSVGSRLDGMIDPREYVEFCLAHGMQAGALTDHGNLSQALKFYVAAKERGFNAIIGQEIYLVDDHTDQNALGQRFHEGLIAMNWEGYKNLVTLSSLGFTQGLRASRYPCIDDTQIAAQSQGLICLSGCISSRLATTLLGGLTQSAAHHAQVQEARTFCIDPGAMTQALKHASGLALSAAGFAGRKKQRYIEEANKRRAFVESIAQVIATDSIEHFVHEQVALADRCIDAAWQRACEIATARQRLFGDRYYLETQIADSPLQHTYNEMVRQLGESLGIPCVITADAHYLHEHDAPLHRTMLAIHTAEAKKKKKPNAPSAIVVPEHEAALILKSSGDLEELAGLYDAHMESLGAKKSTKKYADERERWAKQAQLYFLQHLADAESLDHLDEESAGTIMAIDQGRSYAEWDPQFWVRTPQEMVAAGAPSGEMQEAWKVAQRCDLQIPINDGSSRPTVHMPQFQLPQVLPGGIAVESDWNDDDVLAGLCAHGLRVYLDDHPMLDPRPYHQRLDYELATISSAGFARYFLIVWDYITFTRERGGQVGPGRGSAAGSLVAFLVGITQAVDPLQYRELMFERFLTPGRPDLPDIDTDFDVASAEAVFTYCQERYGSDYVFQIGTFSTLAVRQALADVGRVLEIPYPDVEAAARILKSFRPDEEAVIEDNRALFTLAETVEAMPELKALEQKSPLHQDWFDQSNRLAGKALRNASQHASGIAIAGQPLVELGIPLMTTTTAAKKRITTTQFDMDDLALLGIPKFDQLKLSNLSIIAQTESLIGQEFRMAEIPLNDPDTFRSLSRGDNLGIFQVAAPKVRGILRAVAPRDLRDIAAVITIIRPGLFAKDPVTGLTIEELYKARRQNSLPVTYPHAFLEPILKDTYGCLIYQESAMQILWACGVDILTTDKIRKLMSKKKRSELAVYQPVFLAAAMQTQGLTQGEAEALWALLEEFAGYAFNASHAFAYGLITYWTAYLKTHYPAEFLAATLSTLAQKSTKAAKELIPRLLEDATQFGREIAILPPSLNASQADFAVEFQDSPRGVIPAIRFGLEGIKGVGSLANRIVQERATAGPYQDLADLDARLAASGTRPNKKALESLALAGALDDFFSHRSQALWAIALARESVKYKRQALENAGWIAERNATLHQLQAQLCGDYYFVRENSEVLGREVDNFFTASTNERLTVGGRVLSAKLDRLSKRGKPYHSIVLKTQWGNVAIDFFAGRTADPVMHLQSLREKLFAGAVVIVNGTVRDDRSMYGNTLTLPKALFRGEYQEDPVALAQEARTLLV